MGLFNVLKANIQCGSCGKYYPGQIQFKFGKTDHLFYYLGDRIVWGEHEVGSPNLPKVKVYGILESASEQCPFLRLFKFQ